MAGVPGPHLLPITDFLRSEVSDNCRSIVNILVGVQQNRVVQENAEVLERIYQNAIFSAAKLDGKLNPRARELVTASRDHFKTSREKIENMASASLPGCYGVCTKFCRESANLALSLSVYHLDNTKFVEADVAKVKNAFNQVTSAFDVEADLVQNMATELEATISKFHELQAMDGRTMLKLSSWITVLVTRELTSPDSPDSAVPNHLQARFKKYLNELAVASGNLEIVNKWLKTTLRSLGDVGQHQSRAASIISSHLTEIEIDMQMKLRDVNREWTNAASHFLELIPKRKALPLSTSVNHATLLLENTGVNENLASVSTRRDDSRTPRESLPNLSIFHRITTLLDILSHVPYIKEFADVLRVFLNIYSQHHDAHGHVERLLLEATDLAADAQMEIKEERMDSRDLMQLERLANNLQRLLKGCLQTSKGNTAELQSCAKSCSTGLEYGLQKISFFRLSSLGVEHRDQYLALRGHITDTRDDLTKAFCSSMDRLERKLQADFQDCISRINSKIDGVEQTVNLKVDELKSEVQLGRNEFQRILDKMEARWQQGLANLARSLRGQQGGMFSVVQTAASTSCGSGEGLMFTPGDSYSGGSGVLHHRNGSRHFITPCRRTNSAPG